MTGDVGLTGSARVQSSPGQPDVRLWERGVPGQELMDGVRKLVAVPVPELSAGRVAHLLYRPSNGRNVADPSWAQSQQTTINKLDKMIRDWLANEVVCSLLFSKLITYISPPNTRTHRKVALYNLSLPCYPIHTLPSYSDFIAISFRPRL